MKHRLIIRTAFGVVLLAVVFSMAFSAQSVYIKGVVKNSAGRPQVSVWVTISQGGVEKGRSLTGDDGKYYIGNLNAGVYDIVVQKRTHQVNLPGDSNHDILIR